MDSSMLQNKTPMKSKAILILVVLVVSVLSPFTVNIAMSSPDGVQYLVSLDVCHASGAFVSTNADSPLLLESPCKPVPFESVVYLEPSSLLYVPALYFSRLERPPRS
jgi:hypothetical protein